MNAKILELIQDLAADADLDKNAHGYRRRALEIIDDGACTMSAVVMRIAADDIPLLALRSPSNYLN